MATAEAIPLRGLEGIPGLPGASQDGRDWGKEEKGTTEDEMDGWHHRLDGQEFE